MATCSLGIGVTRGRPRNLGIAHRGFIGLVVINVPRQTVRSEMVV
jgi:hypothetical protein